MYVQVTLYHGCYNITFTAMLRIKFRVEMKTEVLFFIKYYIMNTKPEYINQT